MHNIKAARILELEKEIVLIRGQIQLTTKMSIMYTNSFFQRSNCQAGVPAQVRNSTHFQGMCRIFLLCESFSVAFMVCKVRCLSFRNPACLPDLLPTVRCLSAAGRCQITINPMVPEYLTARQLVLIWPANKQEISSCSGGEMPCYRLDDLRGIFQSK